MSERVAQQMRSAGRKIYPPQDYLDQLGISYPPPSLPRPSAPRIRELPNGYDLFGWIALALCVSSLTAGWLAASGRGAGWVIAVLPHLACAWAARHNASQAVGVALTRAFGTVGLIVSIGSALGVALIAVLLGL